MIKDDLYFMKSALKEAKKSLLSGDVPVGCVIVKENQIIAKAHNEVEKKSNSLLHAEIIAINKAVKKIGYKHLLNCRIYVTLEPCVQCAGSIVLSRITELVYGASDPKAGAVQNLYNICNDPRLNHRCVVRSGVLEKECSMIIKEFFKRLREEKSEKG